MDTKEHPILRFKQHVEAGCLSGPGSDILFRGPCNPALTHESRSALIVHICNQTDGI